MLKLLRADLAVFLASLFGVPVKVRERYWTPPTKRQSHTSAASRSQPQGPQQSTNQPEASAL